MLSGRFGNIVCPIPSSPGLFPPLFPFPLLFPPLLFPPLLSFLSLSPLLGYSWFSPLSSFFTQSAVYVVSEYIGNETFGVHPLNLNPFLSGFFKGAFGAVPASITELSL